MCYTAINYFSDGCPHIYNAVFVYKCALAVAGNDYCEKKLGVWAKVDQACRKCLNDPQHREWTGHPANGAVGPSPVYFDYTKLLREVRWQPDADGAPMKPLVRMKVLQAMQRRGFEEGRILTEGERAEKAAALEGVREDESGKDGCCVCM